MNTRMSYMYRDADNYKTHHNEVLSGEITQQQLMTIADCLDDKTYFIPHQLGLPEMRFDQVTESDHCWFELYPEQDFSSTNGEPTIDMTVDELVERFQKAKGHWDEETFSNYAAAMLSEEEDDCPYIMTSNMMEMRVRVEGGCLVATLNNDNSYPGIDIMFQPDEEVGDEVLSLPRILMEKPVGGDLRVLAWTDSATEDYTKEITFN